MRRERVALKAAQKGRRLGRRLFCFIDAASLED
jgi:hypothetical protein